MRKRECCKGCLWGEPRKHPLQVSDPGQGPNQAGTARRTARHGAVLAITLQVLDALTSNISDPSHTRGIAPQGLRDKDACMTSDAPQRLFDAIDATWPAAEFQRSDGWLLREGRGGGKRVSATTRLARDADLGTAETALDRLGQDRLFMIRPGDEDLDTALSDSGYAVVDPVVLYTADCARLADPGAPHRIVTSERPVALMREIWAEGGVGPARLEVMTRARGPATTLMARSDTRATGCAFVACDGDVAMVHAIEVRGDARRKGYGAALVRAAAFWATGQGARVLALAVVSRNTPARTLYEKLGMTTATSYHYRQKLLES